MRDEIENDLEADRLRYLPMKIAKNVANTKTIVTHVLFVSSNNLRFSTSFTHSPYSGLSAVEFAISAQ